MKPRSPNQVFDEIAQQYTPKGIDLTSRILSRVKKEKVNTMKWKFALTGIFTLAVILAILFAIPSVATAMKRLFGYIPNVGLVENDTPLRVLAEPAEIKREGTTISVTQGVVDLQQTIIIYQVENMPVSPDSPDIQNSDICHQLPYLQLPDGSILKGESNGGNYWFSGYSRRLVFPALPEDVNTSKLIFSCLEQSVISPNFQDLEITLNFVPAPEDTQIYTLIDLPTPIPAPTQDGMEEGGYGSDFRLVINRYTKTDENVILFGILESFSGDNAVEYIEENAVHIIDVAGKEIPLVEDPSLVDPQEEVPNKASKPWAYLTAGAYSAGQATLTVDSAWVRFTLNTRFTVDLGADPQPDQKLDINQTFVVAGHEIVIQSAEINSKGDGISFTVIKPANFGDVNVMDLEHPLLGGGGGPDSCGFTYQNGIPSGEINLTLLSVSINLPGPWNATVELPELSTSNAPADTQSACLTQSSWQNALNNPMVLPEGLGGTLALSNVSPPDYIYRVMTVDLTGTNPQILAKGDSPSLSPDSRQILFNSDTGLQMMDLGSGIVTPLAETWKNDRGPIWSPDGSRIAFTRGPASGLIGAPGPYAIIIANPDGTQQIPVVENGDANSVMAWLPDGQSLLYTVAGPNGSSVNRIDLSTGHVTQLFDTNYVNSGIALSPEGDRVAYEFMLPGDHYGIYASDVDGQNRKLIVDGAPIVVTVPRWSPDGNWLIVSVQDESLPEIPVLALIEVDTCQIIPLTTISGYVSTWNP